MLLINEYILSNGVSGMNPLDMFIGKVSFEDTVKYKKVLLSKGFTEDNIIQPNFIAETAYYIVKNRKDKPDYKFSQEEFLGYLHKKYPIFKEWISAEKIKNMSFNTKKKVMSIVKQVEAV